MWVLFGWCWMFKYYSDALLLCRGGLCYMLFHAFSPALTKCLCAGSTGLAQLLLSREAFRVSWWGLRSAPLALPRLSPEGIQELQGWKREDGATRNDVSFSEEWGESTGSREPTKSSGWGWDPPNPMRNVRPLSLLAIPAMWNSQVFCISAQGQWAEAQHNSSTSRAASVPHTSDTCGCFFPALTYSTGWCGSLGLAFWLCLLHLSITAIFYDR